MAQTTIWDRCPAKYRTPSKADRKKRRAALAVAGIFIGAVNGIFGAGGGMLAVPALTFIAALNDKSAHATAIAVILPLCAISSLMYGLESSFDWGIVLPTCLGVIAGGILGAQLLKKLASDALSFIFYAFMLLAGLKMIFA